MKSGKLVKKIPDVFTARKEFMNQMADMSDYIKTLGKSKNYPVIFDKKLYQLLEIIKQAHL